MAIFFFCGVGGSGMSPIALYLCHQGHEVHGSCRTFDCGENETIRRNLADAGVIVHPQDGSGVTKRIDRFIATRAVEETNPDIVKARSIGLKVELRPEMLAEILNAHRSVAVGGTSGKTTTTAMVGHILYTVGKDPTMINGGISLNTYHGTPISSVIFGQSDLFVAEADESDGSIVLYNPAVAVVTNISLDHKPLPELRALFQDFIRRASLGAVVSADCPETKLLDWDGQKVVRVSVKGGRLANVWAENIRPVANGVDFTLNGASAHLPMIGIFNIENALCALAACGLLGVSMDEGIAALQSFKGTARRLQTLGVEKGVTVIDDFAHNPEKIRATLAALRQYPGRLLLLFQPHGFAPLRLMKEGFISAFLEQMGDADILYMPEAFYAGGTVVRDVSSKDVVDAVLAGGKKAVFREKRADLASALVLEARAGDRIVIMGARDDTLTVFAKEVLAKIKER